MWEYQEQFVIIGGKMAITPASVEVTRQSGKLVVRLMGRTPRGTKYIKKQQLLDAKDTHDPRFKDEMAAVIKLLYESEA